MRSSRDERMAHASSPALVSTESATLTTPAMRSLFQNQKRKPATARVSRVSSAAVRA